MNAKDKQQAQDWLQAYVNLVGYDCSWAVEPGYGGDPAEAHVYQRCKDRDTGIGWDDIDIVVERYEATDTLDAKVLIDWNFDGGAMPAPMFGNHDDIDYEDVDYWRSTLVHASPSLKENSMKQSGLNDLLQITTSVLLRAERCGLDMDFYTRWSLKRKKDILREVVLAKRSDEDVAEFINEYAHHLAWSICSIIIEVGVSQAALEAMAESWEELFNQVRCKVGNSG